MNKIKLNPQNQLQLFGYDNYFNLFINMIKKEKLPNKILLTGISGIGKSTFAHHFINYVFSENEEYMYELNKFTIKKNNKSFKLLNENIHPNFFKIDLKEGSQSIDINQIRDMIGYINKTSFAGNKKFILIDNVENLNINSVNALLKNIENPNENTFFILIYDSSKNIVKTLKSRCLEFKIFFSQKDKFNILNNLLNQSEIEYDSKVLENIVTYYDSPGNIIKKLNYYKENKILLDEVSTKNIVLELINSYKKSNKNDNLEIIKSLIELSFFYKFKKTKNKQKNYLFYSYFIKQIQLAKIYNLDLNNLFLQFKKSI